MSGPHAAELVDLRIIPLERITPHEDHDERRIAALAERIQRDGVIRNPPIVAPLDEHNFVVLDGANRTSALRFLDYPHAVVQVVDYSAVKLSTWNHLVIDLQGYELASGIAGLDEVQLVPSSKEPSGEDLNSGSALGSVVLPDGRILDLIGEGTLLERVELLRSVVSIYNGRSDIHRVQGADIGSACADHAQVAGIIVFPRFTPADVLSIVSAGSFLPSGISRHVIPGRALRINYTLADLAADIDTDEKNRSLQTWFRRKQQAREIRYYEEPTILFDE